MNGDNFVIIGMPGSGKSTFGKRLAQVKQLNFIDTDSLIEQRFGCRLQTVVDRRGLAFMRKLEEETICSLDVSQSVIAPGGSVVYSERAMRHLQQLGQVIYLKITLATLLQRVDKKTERGLFKLPATTLQGLYYERRNLYDQWAHVTLDNNRPLTAMQLAKLLQQLSDQTSS